MNFGEALAIARTGYDRWAEKPHNRKLVRLIDGTPIPNDLIVDIAYAIVENVPRGPAQFTTEVKGHVAENDTTK